jgi:hypothetical protein
MNRNKFFTVTLIFLFSLSNLTLAKLAKQAAAGGGITSEYSVDSRYAHGNAGPVLFLSII